LEVTGHVIISNEKVYNMKVYADNAATTRMCEPALEVLASVSRDIYGNPSSQHEEGQRAKKLLEESRDRIAAILNVSPREIYFTSGGTEADNIALRTGAYIGRASNKIKVIASNIEHHAVLHSVDELSREGYECSYLSTDSNGIVRVQDLYSMVDEHTAIVSVMYANNEIGTIEPVEEISGICHEKGVIFHTDAVQAVGHIPMDIKGIGPDMLSASAHKFGGPKGVGFIYVRNGIRPAKLMYGGPQERDVRPGTENLPSIASMAAALEHSLKDIEAKNISLCKKRDSLIERLSMIRGSYINGDLINRLPGNINVSFEGVNGESMLILLDELGVCVSSGSACTSGSISPSHVLTAIGRSAELSRGAVRISITDDNTDEEIDYIYSSVSQVVNRLRG